jgi:hypothetical protein
MRDQNYITEVRQNAKKFWDAVNALKGLQPEWQALDYGNTLADGEGDNLGYNRAQVGAVVFATTDAILALLASGHATNVANLL